MSAVPPDMVRAFMLQMKGFGGGPKVFNVERALAFCSIVAGGRLASGAFKTIDPRYHSLSVPCQDSEAKPYNFIYSYAENPLIVRSDAINIGIDALRATLRAE